MSTAPIKMRKFLVLKDTYGFRGRYWTADTVVEFPEDVTPDKMYFELITKNTRLPEGVSMEKAVNTLSEAQARPFKKEPTAGDVFAEQKHPGEVPLSPSEKRYLAEHGSEL